MSRFLLALAALLATLSCASFAATPLPQTPSTGWCGDSLGSAGWNGVRACAVAPPPPVDPGAYTTAIVKWLNHVPVSRNTDVTQLWNVFGHIDPTLPVQQWPGAGGTTVALVDNSTRYYRMRFTMPANPGTISHRLTAVSYGKSPANLRARFAVVAAGGAWPTGPDTPCWKSSVPFDDQSGVDINPGAPNTVKCSVAPGATVDVLFDAIGNGTMAITIH